MLAALFACKTCVAALKTKKMLPKPVIVGHFENRESVAVDGEDVIAQPTSSIEKRHSVLSKDKTDF